MLDCLICSISNTRTRIHNIRVLVNIQSFCCILKKNCSVPLILKYRQIECFLQYFQELFCLQMLSSQKRGWMFFKKALLSVILLTFNVSRYFLSSFLWYLLQKILCFYYFFKDSVVFFLWNRVFLNVIFLWLLSLMP